MSNWKTGSLTANSQTVLAGLPYAFDPYGFLGPTSFSRAFENIGDLKVIGSTIQKENSAFKID